MSNTRRLNSAPPPASFPPVTGLPPAANQPDAGQLIGQAIAAVIRRDMPDALARAIWQVHPPRMCAPCLGAFTAWEEAHQDLIAAAMTTAAGSDTPQDWRSHLPEEIRPLVPNVERSVTSVNGTEVCKDHLEPVRAEALAG